MTGWMPLAGLSDEMFRLALRTFYRVFPEMSVWYMNNESTHYILLIGTPKPLRIDYSLMVQKLKNETVNSDLAELYLDDADKILSCFLCDQTSLKDYLAGDKINSENHPYLEFESPKYGYGDQPMIDNLNTLLKHRTSIIPYVFNIPERTAFEERMNRYAEAVPHIIAGHALYRQLLNLRACRKYLEAVRLVPEDHATLKLLDFDELKLRIAARPREPWAYRELGSVYFEQGRHSEAVTALSSLLKNASSPPINPTKDILDYHRDSLIYANKTIGICYIKAGNTAYARPYLEKAHAMSPEDAEIKSLIQKINSK